MGERETKAAPLIISSIGIDGSNEKLLLDAIEHAKEQGVNCHYLGKDQIRSHLVVVDLENDTGTSAYENLRPGQVKLVFSSEKINDKNTVTMAKPLDSERFNSILLKLTEKLENILQKRKEQAQSNIESSPDSAGEEAIIEGEETLFHILYDAKKNLKSIEINANGYPSIMVNGVGNTTTTEMNEDILREALITPIKNVSVKDINIVNIPTASTDTVNVSSLDRSLWSAGIMWRTDKLLGDCDLETPVCLKAWPNFTRNNFFQEHLKLSAALALYPVTLQKLHDITNIPLEEVICFYNAAFSVGLIEINRIDDGDSRAVPEPKVPAIKKDNKRQGLLSKLANQLGFG